MHEKIKCKYQSVSLWGGHLDGCWLTEGFWLEEVTTLLNYEECARGNLQMYIGQRELFFLV